MLQYTIQEIAATLRSWGVNGVRQMEKITTELLVNMPTSPVISGGGENLSGSGDPTTETPSFVGQTYTDTNTGNIWSSNSTTEGDWTLTLQNAQIQWEPKSIEIFRPLGLVTLWDGFVALQGITSLTLGCSTVQEVIYIQDAEELVTLSFPNLTVCDGPAEFTVQGCGALESISAPLLTTLDTNGFSISGNALLTSVVLTSFVSTPSGKGMAVKQSPLLTELSLPALVPINGNTFDFSENGLDQTSIDGILARFVANAAYVSGTLALSGGTNSAPSGTGALMVIDLTNRGVTVTHN